MSIHRKQLNPNQVQLLKLLYKFRFVNSDLLARYKGTTRISVNHSLAILVDQKFVDRRYDNSYKIQGKSALYHLTPTGLRALKGFMPLNDNVVHAMYKNSTVTEGFINDCLLVMEVCITLLNSYPDTFNIFGRSELAEFDYFPEPRPSLYLSRKKPSKTEHNAYMLDIITDNRKFIIKKQVQTYINHYDSGVWGEDQYLREFQDNEKTIPTILTTSQKLSTGVDARNVRNIVLMRPINSMIEFKQIIGRGTRLYDGKEYFTIYDFVDASSKFEDPEWDGPPIDNTTEPKPKSIPPKSKIFG